ncbi:MAG: DUF305 domain-containing protein [Candidatus Falkowbacteria bacterium]|nr:DUF305 domain-containing protein [Candidatus Falkowbacteria bacterium]
MIKTKARVKSKAKTKSIALAIDKPVSKTASMSCGTSCWICPLFKVMIVLFVIMIILWLGFFFGNLSAQSYIGSGYRGMSVTKTGCMKNLNAEKKMCNGAPVDQLASKINSVLKDKEGNEFDKEFLLEMTINHQATLEMAQLALTKSSRADIKTLAQSIIDSRTKELEQMKAWQTDWFTTK